jgi:hypothetical protein
VRNDTITACFDHRNIMRHILAYLASGLLLIATFVVVQLEWVPVLSDANLIFHEAGHVVLFWAPKLPYFLGGTLMQVTVPLVCMVAFVRSGRMASAALMLWWLGQNMVNVGWYMADARMQAIPLLGGDAVQHDWAYLFSELGLLQYDALIGGAVEACGMLCMLIAVVWLWYALIKLSTSGVHRH